jgi:hypothetical protein
MEKHSDKPITRERMPPQDRQFYSIAHARSQDREKGLKAVQSVYLLKGKTYRGPRF